MKELSNEKYSRYIGKSYYYATMMLNQKDFNVHNAPIKIDIQMVTDIKVKEKRNHEKFIEIFIDKQFWGRGEEWNAEIILKGLSIPCAPQKIYINIDEDGILDSIYCRGSYVPGKTTETIIREKMIKGAKKEYAIKMKYLNKEKEDFLKKYEDKKLNLNKLL